MYVVLPVDLELKSLLSLPVNLHEEHVVDKLNMMNAHAGAAFCVVVEGACWSSSFFSLKEEAETYAHNSESPNSKLACLAHWSGKRL